MIELSNCAIKMASPRPS